MNFNKKIGFILFLIISMFITSCRFGLDELFYRAQNIRDRFSGFKEITNEQKPNIESDTKYSVLVINDIHFGKKNCPPKIDDFFNWLDQYKLDGNVMPSFCVANGDLTDTGSYSEYISFKQLEDKLFNEYGIPVFSVLGNHDLFNSGVGNFFDLIKPYTSTYYFSTPKTSFYFLDTANGTLGDEQFDELEKLFNNDNRKKVIFTHYPIYSGNNVLFTMTNNYERIKIIDLFAKQNVKIVLTAHSHSGGYNDFGKYKEYTIKCFNPSFCRAILTFDENAEDEDSFVKVTLF